MEKIGPNRVKDEGFHVDFVRKSFINWFKMNQIVAEWMCKYGNKRKYIENLKCLSYTGTVNGR